MKFVSLEGYQICKTVSVLVLKSVKVNSHHKDELSTGLCDCAAGSAVDR